jgi:hypothetical protein
MIKCTDFTSFDGAGCCKGMGKIKIDEWGVTLHGVPLYEKDGKRWVKPPFKLYKDKNTGETRQAPLITIEDKGQYFELCKKFKDAMELKIGEMNG